jgi:hypothetical protein
VAAHQRHAYTLLANVKGNDQTGQDTGGSTMFIVEFSDWLANTAISQYFQVTLWVIPGMQTIHILCLAMVLAGAVMVDLRILGRGLKSESMAAVAERFLPSITPLVLVLLFTGIVLIIAEPGRTLGNPAFYVKMVCLVLALIVTARLRRYAATATTGDRAPVLLALLSMLLWTTIIVAGRFIAYIEPI